MRHAFHVEGDDADLVREFVFLHRTVDAQSRHFLHLRDRMRDEHMLVFGDALHAHAAERVDGGGQRDGAGHVGRAGFLPRGRGRPGDEIQFDDVDHAAADHVGFARGEVFLRTDQHADAVGRVHLVRRVGDEIDVSRIAVRQHVDAAVRCELRRVDEHQRVICVCERGHVVNRVDDARDVRGAGGGEEAHMSLVGFEGRAQFVHVEVAPVVDPDMHHLRVAAPREVVGMVFHHRGDDHVALAPVAAVRELVHCLGGVLHEDDRVACEIRPDEFPGDVVCFVEDLRGEDGLEARAAVHARIEGHELAHDLEGVAEARGAGAVVEEDVGHARAVDQGHFRVDAHDVGAQFLEFPVAVAKGGSAHGVMVRLDGRSCSLDGRPTPRACVSPDRANITDTEQREKRTGKVGFRTHAAYVARRRRT